MCFGTAKICFRCWGKIANSCIVLSKQKKEVNYGIIWTWWQSIWYLWPYTYFGAFEHLWLWYQFWLHNTYHCYVVASWWLWLRKQYARQTRRLQITNFAKCTYAKQFCNGWFNQNQQIGSNLLLIFYDTKLQSVNIWQNIFLSQFWYIKNNCFFAYDIVWKNLPPKK